MSADQEAWKLPAKQAMSTANKQVTSFQAVKSPYACILKRRESIALQGWMNHKPDAANLKQSSLDFPVSKPGSALGRRRACVA
jgi:hypothetical protein